MNKTLKYINGGKICFGCGACVAGCPTSALRMTEDPEGFGIPRIDFSVCVKCGKCRRMCPANVRSVAAEHAPEFFSVRHRERGVRGASTSGGVFTALSDAVLSRGGAVAGAVWTSELTVCHAVATDACGRDAMRLSKYVQSDTSGVWQEIKRLLEGGKEVLFSGTPCQVAALYSFLGCRPDRLFTVDFICHGVPSPRVFADYLREHEERRGANVVRVRCRDQRLGCVPMRMGIDFSDGTAYLEDCDRDLFFRLFLSGILNRRSCAECPYTRVRRGSDLTIADNWRFASFAPEWADNTGVSALLVNTSRGAALFRAATSALEVKHCTLDDIDQRYLHAPGGEHPDRASFFRAWKRRGFTAAAADFARSRPLYRRLRSRMLKILRGTLRAITRKGGPI